MREPQGLKNWRSEVQKAYFRWEKDPSMGAETSLENRIVYSKRLCRKHFLFRENVFLQKLPGQVDSSRQ
jgi:hypothetical protein